MTYSTHIPSPFGIQHSERMAQLQHIVSACLRGGCCNAAPLWWPGKARASTALSPHSCWGASTAGSCSPLQNGGRQRQRQRESSLAMQVCPTAHKLVPNKLTNPYKLGFSLDRQTPCFLFLPVLQWNEQSQRKRELETHFTLYQSPQPPLSQPSRGLHPTPAGSSPLGEAVTQGQPLYVMTYIDLFAVQLPRTLMNCIPVCCLSFQTQTPRPASEKGAFFPSGVPSWTQQVQFYWRQETTISTPYSWHLLIFPAENVANVIKAYQNLNNPLDSSIPLL